ncbi:MAG: hypothetical protein BroJett025_06970 [Patescibacteria group bacterium]|nr:MAG: hypothetical protein BroJett025_06970 [Patescibacteria group bacterium]
MIITATQKNTRQTALKVRLVANQVRKLPLVDAIKQLGVMQKRASLTVLKVVRQAIANAMHNHGYSMNELTLKNITVTPGPTYKRFRAVSRGRAHTIFKRTCHIMVELEAGSAPKAVKKETKVATEVKEVEPTTVTEKPKVVAPKVKKVAPTKAVAQKSVTRGVRRTGEK